MIVKLMMTLIIMMKICNLISIHTVLKDMQTSGDPRTRDTSKGLLFQLGLLDIHEDLLTEQQQQQEQHATEFNPNSGEEHARDPPPSYQETVDAPHIMISYNWDHQDRALKIRDKLKEKGYNIWMDVDKMGR